MSNDTITVRCIMPRFGVITMPSQASRSSQAFRDVTDNDDYPLIIKVALLPNARLQVYFPDNEDYFKRKSIYRRKGQVVWMIMRSVRYCSWQGEPHHRPKFDGSRYYPLQRLDDRPLSRCSSKWHTKRSRFRNSKVVYTIGTSTFKDKIGADLLLATFINDQVGKKNRHPERQTTMPRMFRAGAPCRRHHFRRR